MQLWNIETNMMQLYFSKNKKNIRRWHYSWASSMKYIIYAPGTFPIMSPSPNISVLQMYVYNFNKLLLKSSAYCVSHPLSYHITITSGLSLTNAVAQIIDRIIPTYVIWVLCRLGNVGWITSESQENRSKSNLKKMNNRITSAHDAHPRVNEHSQAKDWRFAPRITPIYTESLWKKKSNLHLSRALNNDVSSWKYEVYKSRGSITLSRPLSR